MQKIQSIMITFILMINLIIPVYADDEIEEVDVTIEELEQILETAIEIEDIPIINSRNAIIYDRTSRKNFIWKTRKCKMQNGIYY